MVWNRFLYRLGTCFHNIFIPARPTSLQAAPPPKKDQRAAAWMEIPSGYRRPGQGPGEWAWLGSATQWLEAEVVGGRALGGEQQLWVKENRGLFYAN